LKRSSALTNLLQDQMLCTQQAISTRPIDERTRRFWNIWEQKLV